MALTRPTLTALIDRIRADLGTRVLGSATAVLSRSVLDSFAKVKAGIAHGLYGYIAYAAKQVFPDTAEVENLERLSAIWGVTRTAGTKSSGTALFTGTNGTPIDAGTIVKSEDGIQYETTDSDVIAGGVLSLPVEALLAGSDADIATGVILTLESAIAGVDAEATVETPGITGGSDLESDDSLRARLLLRIRKPPAGGTAADYEAWALASHTDVTRAFVQGATPSSGYVTIYIVTDDGAGGVTPAGGVITAAQAYIDARAPITSTSIVAAPTPVALDITVAISPDTAAIRTAVDAELLAMLLNRAEPGVSIRKSWIIEAISSATGEEYNSVTVPTGDTTIAPSEIAVIGTVTYA